MEQVNEAQPQSQPPSQRFYALEQLGELAGTITLISEGLQAYRAQVAGLLAGQKKAEAFELYRLLERQRTYLVEQIRATRPFLMELENPLAPAAQKLAEQLAAFPLMTADYSKLTEVLKRFADALPDHQTTDASIIGRLMNNVRLGHYPTDLTHVGYIANSIVFPAENTANLIDPCCGTGDALLRLALGTDSQCYGIELDDHRAEQAQQQLYRVGFGSFFGSNISPGAFHAVFLNPPYLSVLSENGGRSRDEKRFLIESIPLLMMGGLLIYIVPYYRLTADLCGIICDNFEQVRIHRFLDREFKQFKQVVVTGVRRRRTEAEQDAEALCSAAEHPETLPIRTFSSPKRKRSASLFNGPKGANIMWNKSAEELRAALSAPFQSADIEWRISATNSAKTSGLAVPYHTMIGASGIRLSGGERQRIAIARAIIKDAPIIVLDEATAFSDPENEYLIQKAFEKLIQNKTVIMIAHRLSTIRNADQILVMEHGQLIEQGTHDTLMERQGKYTQMWNSYMESISWKIRAGKGGAIE